MRREYIETGKCIWCGRTREEGATFFNIPHILPHALGGRETCFDVCDECNSYFGDDRKKYGISQDEAVKGILQIGKHYFSLNPHREKSPIFNYFVSEHRITLKRSVLHTITPQGLTRQFKRGMCECFLQKYHYLTKDGNSPVFDKLRKFARYDDGDIPFYCVINKILIGFIDQKNPIIGMSQKDIANVKRCGLFTCYIFGHVIIMDVVPNAPHIEKMIFCDDFSNLGIIAGSTISIERLTDISKLDLLYTRYNGFQSAALSDTDAYMPFIEEPQKN